MDDFLPRTTRHFQNQAISVAISTSLSRGESAQEVTWEDVVRYARAREHQGHQWEAVAPPPPPVAKPLDGVRYREGRKNTGSGRRGEASYYAGGENDTRGGDASRERRSGGSGG